jgi:methionyl-tRNA formyltransferase
MRIGILASTLPSALRILDEIKSVPGCDLYILLCRASRETGARNLFKHMARFVLKGQRLRGLRLLMKGRVFLFRHTLDDPRAIAALEKLQLDVGLHNLGDIYREPTINAFRLGILNPHIGILPQYRGRSVMEWALLEGRPIGITVFLIDEGIDTGERIVLREEVDISQCGSIARAKAYLFDLDAVFFRRALELLRSEEFSFEHNDGNGPRYYVMSGLFQNVADELLRANG